MKHLVTGSQEVWSSERVKALTMSRITSKSPAHTKVRRPAATLIAGVALALVVTLTAFAAGNVIYRFVVGESSEAKDKIMSMSIGNNIVLHIGSTEVTMDEYYAPHTASTAGGDMWKHFLTAEEANIFSRFTVKIPSYIPEDTSLTQASVIINGDGLPGYTVVLSFNGNTALYMDYVGDNAFIDVREVSDAAMQKIIVGGTEGVAVSRGADLWTLIWMKDGVLYRLERYYFHGDERFNGDLDTLIAIAESL